MSELTDKLTAAGLQHKNADLGGLIHWAVLHITEQKEALATALDELEAESNERIRLERTLHTAAQDFDGLLAKLKAAQSAQIALARDHAPHINIMAHHGVAPYAKKPRKKKDSA